MGKGKETFFKKFFAFPHFPISHLLLAVHFAGESHEDGKDEGENDCTGKQGKVFHAEEDKIDGIADGKNQSNDKGR